MAKVESDLSSELVTTPFIIIIEVFFSTTDEVRDFLVKSFFIIPKNEAEFKYQEKVTPFRLHQTAFNCSAISDLRQEFIFINRHVPDEGVMRASRLLATASDLSRVW